MILKENRLKSITDTLVRTSEDFDIEIGNGHHLTTQNTCFVVSK